MTNSIEVPACEARAFEIIAGQRFRIVAPDGPQVCDAVFLNADNHGETFASDMSVFINQAEGTGDLSRIETLYSRPPGMRPMARVTEDTIGHHFPWAGGMCCSLLYELRDDDPTHANCADNLLAALHEAGVECARVPEVFNVGMHVDVVDGDVVYRDPEFGAGDYIEFEAAIDLLVAASACPNDTSVINEGDPKRLRIDVGPEA